jgi:hypothetical protein
MATYYKYAERAAGSQVNWAEIGKNLTDTLNEENKLREEKKAAIDEATRQYGLELEKSPQGDNVTFNQWGLDYAGDAQEARLLQDRLLRQGKLKLKDYTIMRQNLTDGTNQAFNLLDEYNAEYKEKMARAKSMDPATRSQYLEQWLMSKGEMFANLKDSKLYINPTTFAVSVAKIKDENGVRTMSNNPNDFTTINDLRNYIKSKYDYFDSDSYLTKQVGMLGTEIKDSIISGSSYKVGQKITIEDITEKDGAKEAISAMINTAFAGMPTNISSVLTNDLGSDSLGNKFDFTFDKTEMGKIVDGKNLIYFDPNGEPQFTKEQEKAAKDYMLQKLSVMLTRKETIDVYTEPRPVSTGGGGGGNRPTEGQSKAAGLGNLIGYLYSGDEGQINTAIDALKNMEGVEDVQRFRDRVEIKFDGDSEYRPFKFGSTIQDFVRSFGYALDPASDLNAMVAGAYNIGNPVLNQDYETGIDFIGQFPNGYDPNSYMDQLKMQRLKTEYEQRMKEYRSRTNQGGTGKVNYKIK